MSVILSARHEQVERVAVDAHDLPGLYAWRVGNRVGESPVWDANRDANGEANTQALLWIDVRAPAVLRLDPRTGQLTSWPLPETVGALGLAHPGSVVLALQRSLALLELATGRLDTLVEVRNEPAGNRLNDGKVSPSGRWFVFGSMDDRAADKRATGALYCAACIEG